MSVKALKKEELELLSNKDIAEMIIEESKIKRNTADLFKKIIKMLELPESTFETKIADFYTALATDKRFVLLENGKWDLRSNHKSDSLIKISDSSEEEEDEEEDDDDEDLDKQEDLSVEDSYDDDDDYDEDTNEELKGLVVIDEDELELE